MHEHYNVMHNVAAVQPSHSLSREPAQQLSGHKDEPCIQVLSPRAPAMQGGSLAVGPGLAVVATDGTCGPLLLCVNDVDASSDMHMESLHSHWLALHVPRHLCIHSAAVGQPVPGLCSAAAAQWPDVWACTKRLEYFGVLAHRQNSGTSGSRSAGTTLRSKAVSRYSTSLVNSSWVSCVTPCVSVMAVGTLETSRGMSDSCSVGTQDSAWGGSGVSCRQGEAGTLTVCRLYGSRCLGGMQGMAKCNKLSRHTP